MLGTSLWRLSVTPHPTQTRERIIVSRCFEKQRETLYKPVRIQKKEKRKKISHRFAHQLDMKEFRVLKINVSPASLGMRPGSRQVVMLPSTPPSPSYLPPKKKKSHDKRHTEFQDSLGTDGCWRATGVQNCHEKKRSRTWSCSATPTEKKKKKTLRGVTIFDCGNLQMSSETICVRRKFYEFSGPQGGNDGRTVGQ